MQSDGDLHNLIATALTGLVKQIKAVRYYPPKHPALKTTAEESLRGFVPLITGVQSFSLKIRKEGFLFDDQPVAKGNQVLTQLATFCFARRIQHLTILPDLAAEDLHRFVHCLVLAPQEIQQLGGIQTVLEKSRIASIWLNEQDLAAILEKKEELEQKPPEPEFDPAAAVAAEGQAAQQQQDQAQALDLEKFLKLLHQEKDDQKFRNHLQEIIPLVRLNLNPESRPLILKTFILLCQNATGKKLSEARREHSLNALGQLATDDLADYLIDYLIDKETPEKVRNSLIQVLAFLRDKVVRRLMEHLAEEGAAVSRKLLAEVLVKTGASAIPVMQEYLFDDRWYVVRNAVAILGEIRNQDTLVHLTPLLQHKDIRVRRETIRALTKIGGQRAINILLQAAESGDQELRRQALLSLGAIRAASAVPTLLAMLRQSDYSRKTVDLKKDAIRALAEIRATDAMKDLVKIARAKRLFRKTLHEELRIAAIGALGEIGGDEALAALEKISNDRSAPVARAATLAMKNINKGT